MSVINPKAGFGGLARQWTEHLMQRVGVLQPASGNGSGMDDNDRPGAGSSGGPRRPPPASSTSPVSGVPHGPGATQLGRKRNRSNLYASSAPPASRRRLNGPDPLGQGPNWIPVRRPPPLPPRRVHAPNVYYRTTRRHLRKLARGGFWRSRPGSYSSDSDGLFVGRRSDVRRHGRYRRRSPRKNTRTYLPGFYYHRRR